MHALTRMILLLIYPAVILALVIPHQIGRFFHRHYFVYLTTIALLLLSVSGYAGYTQMWEGNGHLIEFQIFCIAATLYSPFHFLVTLPYEEQFDEFNQWLINTVMGGPPKDS